MKKIILVTALILSMNCYAVTREQAESDPSNAELNRTYAIEMLAKGDLSEALSGIERTIIAAPTDIPARFFRAKVLVLLGRGDEVKDELEFITTLKLAPGDIDEAKKLLAEIEKAQRSFSGSVTVQLGVGYNDNANGYSKTGLSHGTTPMTTVYSVDKKHADTITNGAVIFSGQSTLNESKSLALKYVAGKTISNGADTHEKDMGVTLGNIGLRYTSKSGLYTEGKVGITDVDRTNKVDGADFASDISTTKYSLEFGKTFAGGTKVSYLLSDSSDENSGYDTAKRADTSSTQHDLRLSAPLGQSALLSASAYVKDTEADDRTYKDNYDKETTGYGLNVYHFLAPGHLMIYGYSSSSTDFDSYTVPSDGGIRSDESTTLSLKYRIDGDKFFSGAKDWKLTFGASQRDSDSNYKRSASEVNTFDMTLSRVYDL